MIGELETPMVSRKIGLQVVSPASAGTTSFCIRRRWWLQQVHSLFAECQAPILQEFVHGHSHAHHGLWRWGKLKAIHCFNTLAIAPSLKRMEN
jgi:hypothetical protein